MRIMISKVQENSFFIVLVGVINIRYFRSGWVIKVIYAFNEFLSGTAVIVVNGMQFIVFCGFCSFSFRSYSLK